MYQSASAAEFDELSELWTVGQLNEDSFKIAGRPLPLLAVVAA